MVRKQRYRDRESGFFDFQPSKLKHLPVVKHLLSGDHLQSRTSTKAPTTRDEQINHNLGQMSDGLSRLKNLGLTLQVRKGFLIFIF